MTNSATISRVYEYIAPINGIQQGNYEPIIQLIAPTKVQVATFLGKYKPTEKTAVDFEIGISNNDKNLFSTIDDTNNKGLAGKINAKQRVFSKKWQMDAFANYQFIQNDFKSVERLYNIEFDRDWNIGTAAIGNQSLLVSGLQLELNPKPKSVNKGLLLYQFENWITPKLFGQQTSIEWIVSNKKLDVPKPRQLSKKRCDSFILKIFKKPIANAVSF